MEGDPHSRHSAPDCQNHVLAHWGSAIDALVRVSGTQLDDRYHAMPLDSSSRSLEAPLLGGPDGKADLEECAPPAIPASIPPSECSVLEHILDEAEGMGADCGCGADGCSTAGGVRTGRLTE